MSNLPSRIQDVVTRRKFSSKHPARRVPYLGSSGLTLTVLEQNISARTGIFPAGIRNLRVKKSSEERLCVETTFPAARSLICCPVRRRFFPLISRMHFCPFEGIHNFPCFPTKPSCHIPCTFCSHFLKLRSVRSITGDTILWKGPGMLDVMTSGVMSSALLQNFLTEVIMACEITAGEKILTSWSLSIFTISFIRLKPPVAVFVSE